MKKFTFTVDVVGVDANVDEIVSNIRKVVQSHGEYNCVDHVDTTEFTDQGLKVWTKRKIGVSLAQPKKKKAKTQKVEAVAETVQA